MPRIATYVLCLSELVDCILGGLLLPLHESALHKYQTPETINSQLKM